MTPLATLRSALLAALTASAALTAIAQATDQPAPAQPTTPAPPAQPAPAPSADDERAQVQLAFSRADADGDGKLSVQEAGRLPAVAAKFAELDRDHDGFISNAEFMSGVRIQH